MTRDQQSYPLPLERLYHWESTTPSRIFLHQPILGSFTEYTWLRAAEDARRIASALQALNLPPGSRIALLSKNCAHFVLADLAIWMSGHVSVPLYPNTNAETVRTILEHCDAKVIFVGKLDCWSQLEPGVPEGVHRIFFPYYDGPAGSNWVDLLATFPPMREDVYRDPEELATLIYTSGTTGMPKGVMHSFRSIAAAGVEVPREFALTNEDVFFSYLPLAHVAERMVVETCALYCGGTIHFAESTETFADDLREARPTVFLAVPRIWTKFQQSILAKVPQAKLDGLLRLPWVSKAIQKKIQAQLGLSRARILITGAAPIPVATLEWFEKLGLTIAEAYAMSENFAYSHLSRPGNVRFGAAGQPLPKVVVEISPEGEIQIDSPCNMMGYYREPELTAQVFRDRFLRTGDLGQQDGQGFLRITGRLKELFKTSKGKYIAPAPIEMRLSRCAHVEQVCLVGAGFPQPIALVTLSQASRSLDSASVSRELNAFVSQLNSSLAAHEKISNVVVLPESWTPDNGFLTPTLKIKRSAIETRYAESLPQWSYHSDAVVWHR